MLNRKNKKGFTLAELLIVVAIIAVLVAIAVPLFVGSLNKAQEARDKANIRAVRGTAVVYLLENANGDVWYSNKEAKTKATGWGVKATLSETGEITNLEFDSTKTAADDTYPADGKVDGTIITLFLAPTEVKSLKPAT